MPMFFTVTPPPESNETQSILGPFSSTIEAENSRNAMIADGLGETATIGEIFEETLSWFLARPKPQTSIPQDDGSTLEIWTDGSQRIIPAQ